MDLRAFSRPLDEFGTLFRHASLSYLPETEEAQR